MFSGGCVLDMAEFLSGFNLQLLVGVISLSLLQNISADLLSVDPGENVTLPCNITNYSEISWYHMNSAGVRQIISTTQGKVGKHFYIAYNEDESHFTITESSSSVSLVIIGVRDTDLGFYYCGGRNKGHNQFGKVISLNFTGGTHQSGGTENIWIIHMAIMCVCSISVLIIIICMCVFCSRVEETSSSLSSGCSHDTSSTEQDEKIHHDSLLYDRKFTGSVKNNKASDLDCVTYVTFTSQPQRH
ncbi:uncharacterized protein LOC113634389 [Tachysurus fulvidraco]|uniref:uncharacterized protein LOC113634389 n=1 Tax=Tachysurus fulvidraco TaxID=1234273 RepID=UPI001FEE3B12|nr:uncharacterized protein LOC113634389 [Tachysurus fulvidraco]